MNAEGYRRNARRYLARARQMMDPENRAVMIDLAARWMRLAEIFEAARSVQQQQQIQPKDHMKDKK